MSDGPQMGYDAGLLRDVLVQAGFHPDSVRLAAFGESSHSELRGVDRFSYWARQASRDETGADLRSSLFVDATKTEGRGPAGSSTQSMLASGTISRNPFVAHSTPDMRIVDELAKELVDDVKACLVQLAGGAARAPAAASQASEELRRAADALRVFDGHVRELAAAHTAAHVRALPEDLHRQAEQGALKLQVGASYRSNAIPGWLNIDAVTSQYALPSEHASVVLKSIGVKSPQLPLPAGSCSHVYAAHFAEHLGLHDGAVRGFLAEVHAKLAPGGVLRIAVPNAEVYFREALAGLDGQGGRRRPPFTGPMWAHPKGTFRWQSTLDTFGLQNSEVGYSGPPRWCRRAEDRAASPMRRRRGAMRPLCFASTSPMHHLR
ncbi:unnamed protein product [Prorocentrum cordatum]|uniref:Uncharacterized protein n=1 Tax=Prorocentrum cordatum TaxID=2364126 RepID=A0ABN9PCB3_9DINO|nr:unnamed protein product [Polarella glacialis]